MKILAIESSCDETSCAIVENGKKIVSHSLSSSQNLHIKTGGIIPENAARQQLAYILPVIEKTIKDAYLMLYHSNPKKGLSLLEFIGQNIDALAVTVGPGLIGSLLVGVETAKTISVISRKPIVPVNHIFAHPYANWLNTDKEPELPAILLIISGGHTELFYMKNHGQLKWVGGTRDDACGEAFDKTARLLGLGYPGGPAIAIEAERYRISDIGYRIKLPRPMIGSKNLEFSFSGLKTAVLKEINLLKEKDKFDEHAVNFFAYEIQESITDVIVSKALSAVGKFRVKSLILGGGVAANQRLKEKFKTKISNRQPTTYNLQLYIPPPNLCTDNAMYIASYAYYNYHPVPWQEVQARADLDVEV